MDTSAHELRQELATINMAIFKAKSELHDLAEAKEKFLAQRAEKAKQMIEDAHKASSDVLDQITQNSDLVEDVHNAAENMLNDLLGLKDAFEEKERAWNIKYSEEQRLLRLKHEELSAYSARIDAQNTRLLQKMTALQRKEEAVRAIGAKARDERLKLRDATREYGQQ